MPDMEWYTTRNHAQTVGCPWCHVAPGEPCVIPGGERNPIERFPAHIVRIKLAKDAEAQQ